MYTLHTRFLKKPAPFPVQLNKMSQQGSNYGHVRSNILLLLVKCLHLNNYSGILFGASDEIPNNACVSHVSFVSSSFSTSEMLTCEKYVHLRIDIHMVGGP